MTIREILLLILTLVNCNPGIEGPAKLHSVSVRVSLDADGKPKQLEIQSGDPRFHAAALDYARNAIYGVKYDDDCRRIPYEVTLSLPFTSGGKIVGGRRRPVRVGTWSDYARVVHRVDPAYPAAARSQRVQGVVLIKAHVDERGMVTKTEVIRGHPLLRDAAVAAVSKWKYKPTIVDCQPVPGIAIAAVNFVLR